MEACLVAGASVAAEAATGALAVAARAWVALMEAAGAGTGKETASVVGVVRAVAVPEVAAMEAVMTAAVATEVVEKVLLEVVLMVVVALAEGATAEALQGSVMSVVGR